MCGIVAIFSPGPRSNANRSEGDATPPSPRARRAAPLDQRRPPGRPRPCAAQHHRPRDRRPADRQRGRAHPHRRQRRVLRLRARSSASSSTAGHRLRTRSDSEIALHLYEDLGAAVPAPPARRVRLRALGRDATGTLFAARDRFGIKPLFYAVHDGTLYLASEVKALFAAGVPARWDAESVFHAVELRRPSGAHAVRRRLPGAARPLPARDRRRTSSCTSYWDFDYPRGRRGRAAASDAEYAEPSSARCSRRPSGCACAPTCRSAAT